MESRLITCPCLIVLVVVASVFEGADGIHRDVDTGLPSAPACSCLGSSHCMVKLRAVMTLKTLKQLLLRFEDTAWAHQN